MGIPHYINKGKGLDLKGFKMQTWQQNFMNNLIVFLVLASLAIIIYCRVMNKTLLDVVREMREIFSGGKDE